MTKAVMLWLILFTSLAASASDCAPHLLPLGVSGTEARFWSRRARSRDAFFAVSSTLKMIERAPPDVWDLLAIARLGPLPHVDPLACQFIALMAPQGVTSDLEILFETEQCDIRTEIAAVIALGIYGSKAAIAWFEEFRRYPARIFVLARTLQTFPKASYEDSRGFINPQPAKIAQIILARLKTWRPKGQGWRPIFASSRLLTANLIVQRFNHYQLEKGAVTSDAEAMAEWSADQIAALDPKRRNISDETVPPHWRKFLASIFLAIDQPAHQQRRDQNGVTVGDRMLASTLRGAIYDLLQPMTDDDGGGRWNPGLFATKILTYAYAQQLVDSEGGTRALGLILDAVGMSFKRGSDLRAEFAPRLATNLGRAFHEYFPLNGREPGEAVEPTEEPIFTPPALKYDAPSEPGALFTEARDVPASDTLPAFADIEPETIYQVNFARPHPKFSGSQSVMFTEDALKAIARHREVEPDTWLEALRRGMAGAFRERGVKILIPDRRRPSAPRDARIKLKFSIYRVTGVFWQGVWIFNGFGKGH